MPDWKHIENYLVRAWGAYQRASHAAPAEALASLADLLNASRELEREAERALVELEGAGYRQEQAPTVVSEVVGSERVTVLKSHRRATTVSSSSSSLPTVVVDGRRVGT